jgi:hypothetical protein
MICAPSDMKYYVQVVHSNNEKETTQNLKTEMFIKQLKVYTCMYC